MAEVAVQIESLDDEQLDVLERQIANKYMRIVPWGAVAWGLGNFVAFVSLFPLVLMDLISLWVAFPLASLCAMLAYLPSHEAQHNIIAGKGKPLRWLNELVGHLSTVPLVLPYRVLRGTHMEHHAHANDPELDPDIGTHAESDWAFWKKAFFYCFTVNPQSEDYAQALQRTGQAHFMMDVIVYELVFVVVMAGMAWTGHALEAALLWWLPRHIGSMYLSYYLAWAPHHPGDQQGRYRDTRAFKSRFGNVVSMGMQYHIVHHLYPRIPLSLTPAAYRELKPILQRRGCELGEL